MKIREIERTANVAWSPAQASSIYLACGTAAQHIDLNFNSSCALEIYELNLRSEEFVLKPKATVQTDHRYNKIVWSKFGMDDHHPLGVIATGSDNGLLEIYSASNIIAGDSNPLQTSQKHVGTINAMDFNPFQPNLLASGASDSEIFMWDLEKPGEYSTPGSKSQPTDDVTALAWNKQTPRILASGFSSRVVIWDFGKSEPILKLAESSRARCKSIAWNPDVALQLAVASEDDHLPVIQIWDLRYAAAPLRSLEGHSSGVLSISWCQHDSDLLVSSGKDDRVLLWNPNSVSSSGEIVSELHADKWCFDVQFCPKNPALVSVADFNGKIGVYSIMGGVSTAEQQVNHASSNIADSFPGMDAFALPQPPSQQFVDTITRPPTHPPKWMKQPCRPSFSFGGKLVTGEEHTQHGMLHRNIRMYQVTTDPEMVEKSMTFANAFVTDDILGYCDAKVASSKSAIEANVWLLIRSNFVQDPRHDQIQVLGYNQGAVASKVNAVLGKQIANPVEILTNGFSGLSTQEGSAEDFSHLNGSDAFDALALSSRRTPDVVARKSVTPEPQAVLKRLRVPTDDSSDGLISQALVTGNLVAAIDLCTKDERWADALILSMSGGQELLAATQRKYFKSVGNDVSRLIGGIVAREWSNVSALCDLSSWKEVVATAIMFGTQEEVQVVCQTLAERLESSKGGVKVADAALCYILAGNLDALVRCWEAQNSQNVDNETLQDFVEQLMVIKKALQLRGQQNVDLPELAAAKISSYANLLASEGQLELALMLLGNLSEKELPELRFRLEFATGHRQPVQQATTTSRRVSGSAKSVVTRQQSAPHQQPPVQQPNMYTPAAQQSNVYAPGHQPNMYTPAAQQPNMYTPAAPPSNIFTPGPPQPYGQSPTQQQPFTPASGYPSTAPPFGQQPHIPARPPSRSGFGAVPPMTAFNSAVASVAPPPVSATPPPSSQSATGSRRPRVPDPSLSGGYQSSFGGSAQPQMFSPAPQFQQSPFGGVPMQPEPHPGAMQSQYGDPFQPPKTATPQPPPPMRDEQRGWNDPPPMSAPSKTKLKQRRAVPEAPAAPAFQPSYGQTAPGADMYGNQPGGYQSQQGYGSPMGSQQGYGAQVGSQPVYGAQVGSQSGYGAQVAPQPGYAAQVAPQPGYAAQVAPQSGYGAQAGYQGYGAVQTPSHHGYAAGMGQQAPVQTQPSYASFPTSQQAPAMMSPPTAGSAGNYGQSAAPPPAAQSYNAPPLSATAPGHQFHQDLGASNQSYRAQPTPPPPTQPHMQTFQQPQMQATQVTTEYANEAVEKAPIPAEHQNTYDVIEELRQRVTAAVATAAPMKRKLDEVSRKMDLLYDKLRNNELSPTVLDLLYRITEAVKQGDYAAALGIHQQMTSSGSYGEIVNFMPSLKVLLQLAPQNGIYLR